MIRIWRTPLDLPLAPLLAGALVGVWASYDPATSWVRFSLIVMASLLYYGLVLLRRAPELLITVMGLLLVGAAALALYFVTQHDFASDSKFGPIRQIGLSLNQILSPLRTTSLHPNSVAGILELALPLNLGLLAYMRRTTGRMNAALILLASIIAFGLVMTSSRGAWLALALVASAAAMAWLVSRIREDGVPHAFGWTRRWVLFGILLACAGIGSVLVASEPLRTAIVQSLAGLISSEGEVPRLELYGQVWNLIRDYTFTGVGLGMFPMVYSTYALLINVSFLPHAHNWFLQVWIDQGLLGAASYVGLVLCFYGWAWRRRHELNELAKAAIAATTVMWLHGLIDAPLWYRAATTSLQFLPVGLAVAAVRNGRAPTSAPAVHRSRWPAALALILLGIGILCASKPIAARWHANIGSVEQTREELSRYRFPDTLVEFVRRDVDMAQAEASFRQALALDSGNVTANQRLAEIALARGRFTDALEHLQVADERGPNNRVTWQLLGDAYLGMGRLDDAYRMWSRIDDAVQKLQVEAAVRYDKYGDRVRADWTRTLALRIEVERDKQSRETIR